MNRLFAWCKQNLLYIFSLFLLAFIPLYPKFPLVDVQHVWVYVRLEDFVVLLVVGLWVIQILRKKVTLKTPLTMPFLIFWLMGGIATIHGLLLVFPDAANVYPNVAFLSYLRRIEYMSLFFIAYAGMKEKRLFSSFIVVFTMTILSVTLYGIGQRYLYFPAILTMNEEFAKGTPLTLSTLSRVSSTFAGQYDLAAYLVLVLPIVVSLIFGYRKAIVKAFLLGVTGLGLFVLYMTVSRISFVALLVALGFVLLFQKKRLVLFTLPIVILGTVVFLSFSPRLLDRFGSTVKQIDVLVDSKTGYPIGQVREVPNTYFENKIVKQQFSRSIDDLSQYASDSAALVIPYTNLPGSVLLLVVPNAPTGENLPQGTSYINLSLAPVTKRLGNFFYESKPNPQTGEVATFIINGDYLVKKAFAYDLSFTTRFQGEWPNALAAFKRNVFLGSGYGSVSLAVDNSYLRMLGETGALGFISFLAIFIVTAVYVKKALPGIEHGPIRSFVLGVVAGMIGLGVNALFIDVFEASKIAFSLWILVGTVLAIAHMYQNGSIDPVKELKRIATSTNAILLALLVLTILLYSQLTRNYFVGDDFTWLRWAADCGQMNVGQSCRISVSTIWNYFAHANGFFWRPGTKIYFLFMYAIFWLNQTAYHFVSIALHFFVISLVYLLAKKVFKRDLFAALSGLLFVILSGYSESIFWISTTGHMLASLFMLASLLTYIRWEETKWRMSLVLTVLFCFVALTYHEMAIVTPLLYLLYHTIYIKRLTLRSFIADAHWRTLFIPLPVYLVARLLAQSHWLNGDYSYSLIKLPFNVAGNTLGYLMITIIGPLADPVYQVLRTDVKNHILLASGATVVLVGVAAALFNRFKHVWHGEDGQVLRFGVGWFFITLLPFLGLGNITSRYSYVASIGIVFILVFLINKLYAHLLSNGKEIAITATTVIVGIFFLLQILQIQQMHSDWYEAGERVRRFFVSMESYYDDSWKSQPVEFHFVNVPLRVGEAWVFPVGLPDALWFVYGNPKVRVFQWPTVSGALAAVSYDSKTQKIFVFDDSGTVTEVKKPPPLIAK